jgi:hypothetical protein
VVGARLRSCGAACRRAHLDERFQLRALPPADIKGVSQPVPTFAVEGFAEHVG